MFVCQVNDTYYSSSSDYSHLGFDAVGRSFVYDYIVVVLNDRCRNDFCRVEFVAAECVEKLLVVDCRIFGVILELLSEFVYLQLQNGVLACEMSVCLVKVNELLDFRVEPVDFGNEVVGLCEPHASLIVVKPEKHDEA